MPWAFPIESSAPAPSLNEGNEVTTAPLGALRGVEAVSPLAINVGANAAEFEAGATAALELALPGEINAPARPVVAPGSVLLVSEVAEEDGLGLALDGVSAAPPSEDDALFCPTPEEVLLPELMG